jgi:hypothetical protein
MPDRTKPLEAQFQAQLVGSAVTEGGEQGALIFTVEGSRLTLTLDPQLYNGLVRAAALWQTRARDRGGEVPPIPIEKWSAERQHKSVILTLQVFGGLELQFQVSPETERGRLGSDSPQE